MGFAGSTQRGLLSNSFCGQITFLGMSILSGREIKLTLIISLLVTDALNEKNTVDIVLEPTLTPSSSHCAFEKLLQYTRSVTPETLELNIHYRHRHQELYAYLKGLFLFTTITHRAHCTALLHKNNTALHCTALHYLTSQCHL